MATLRSSKQCQRSSSSSSSATIRRTSDDTVCLVRSEYSDEIRSRNLREDRKLENARRYLDRACRVVSNEMDQHRATIMRSLARTRQVASAAAADQAAATAAGRMMRRRSSAEAKRPASTSAHDSRRKRDPNESPAVGYEPLGTGSDVVQISNGTRKTVPKQIVSRERSAEPNQNDNNNSAAKEDDDDRGQSVATKESYRNKAIFSINTPIRIGSKGFGCQRYRYLLNKDSSHTTTNVNETQALNPRPETRQ